MPGGLFWLGHQAYQGYDVSRYGSTFTQAVAALSPTAHWPLNEASGTAAADVIGDRDGVYLNTPTLGVTGWASDGTGVTFTRASNEGVQVPDHADNDLGTSDFSVMLAVNMGSPWYTSDYQGWFCKGAGNPYLIGSNSTADRLSLYLVDTSYDLDITTDLTDGWHLVLITADRSGNASAYIDGATSPEATVDISAKVATDLSSAADLYLGLGNASSYPFGGGLQHVAYWKGTLISGSQFATVYAARNGTGTSSGGGGGAQSQADIYQAAVLALSPIAYYKMDETSGDAIDSSTTANNGTYYNAPTMGVAGPFAGATGVAFDGSTQWVQAGYDSALDLGAADDFSIVLWFKSSADNIYRNLIGRTGAGDWDDYDLQVAYDQLRSNFGNADEDDAIAAVSSATYVLDDSAWHMLAMTADRDGNCIYYVDNVADGTTDISSYQHELTGAKALYIARSSLAGSHVAGSIAQVAIFPSALSSGQIGTLWTAAGK